MNVLLCAVPALRAPLLPRQFHDTEDGLRPWRVRFLRASRGALFLAMLVSLGTGFLPITTPAEPAPPHTEASPLVLGEADIWRLAESLLAESEYYRAVTEYTRLIFYFPASEYATQAQQRIALALLLGGEPRQALAHIDAHLPGSHGADRDRWLQLRAQAWLDLDAGQPMPLRKANVDHALADLAEVSPAAPTHDQIGGFRQALEAPPDLPYKSPALAGTMSAVLPGAGSFYVGRYSEGALSFFVNALLIGGTVTAFQEHQDGLGVGLGVLALAFYGGNIYAAVSGAHKFNDRAEAEYLDQQRVRFGLILERGRIGAAFQSGF